MKKILFIFTTLIVALNTYAQDVDYVEVQNDVVKIGKKISGLGGYNDGTTLIYHHDYIELYSDGTSKEYVLKIMYNRKNEMYIFSKRNVHFFVFFTILRTNHLKVFNHY